jgi:hypothetical protein
MAAKIKRNADHSITVSVTFSPGRSMLESEEALQKALNEAGAAASGECLKNFDSDGSPLVLGGKKFTVKGGRKMPKIYQSPYGEVLAERYIYQSSAGGALYCPMELNARIVRTATPMFAKQVSFKYGHNNASEVVQDFAQHGRTIDRSFVREVAADVASIRSEKEGAWSYEVPTAAAGDRITTITVGVDGTCALFCKEDWKQVMVGTIAFYNQDGERVDTLYVANAPESGKSTFYEAMETELRKVKARYPDLRYVAIADGAHDQWNWLEKHTAWAILDFWHASEYTKAVAPAFAVGKAKQDTWAEQACHRLKHEKDGASNLLAEFKKVREGKLSKAITPLVDKAITYFENQIKRMDYHLFRLMGFPIGSGVTEAACKCIAKERLCGSGMRWSLQGADNVLSLRAMIKSSERWEEFWKKLSQFGFSKITRRRRPT